MRLPAELKVRIDEVCELTGNSLNALIVEAADFFCTMSEVREGAQVQLPRGIILARAAAEAKRSPKVIDLGERYAQIRPAGPHPTLARAAEDEPLPGKAQTKRAAR